MRATSSAVPKLKANCAASTAGSTSQRSVGSSPVASTARIASASAGTNAAVWPFTDAAGSRMRGNWMERIRPMFCVIEVDASRVTRWVRWNSTTPTMRNPRKLSTPRRVSMMTPNTRK